MLPTFSDYVAKQAPKTHADSVNVLTTWLKATKPLALKNLAEEPHKPVYDYLASQTPDTPSVRALSETGELDYAQRVADQDQDMRRMPQTYLIGGLTTQAVILGVTGLAFHSLTSVRGRLIAAGLSLLGSVFNWGLHGSLYAGAKADYQDFLKNGP